MKPAGFYAIGDKKTLISIVLQSLLSKKKYQIHLKSPAGPIYVLLVNKDTDSTSPVVVQVPPPCDDLVTNLDQNQNTQGKLRQVRCLALLSVPCFM